MTSRNKHFVELLSEPELRAEHIGILHPPEGATITTCDRVYYAGINEAIGRLETFFATYQTWLQSGIREHPLRPLNCLLLGAPGSGKTTIAKKLTESPRLRKRFGNCEFRSVNISNCTSPGDVVREFSRIGLWRSDLVKYQPLIVLVDEFDVRIGGASAVQNMISPMYEGKDSEGKPLHGIAFVFSGSYLRDKSMLARVRSLATRLDLVRLCLDLYTYLPTGPARERAHEMLRLAIEFERLREMGVRDDRVQYLRNLEKIDDFLSRINGFVLELPPIDAPLDCTQDPFVLKADPTGDNAGCKPTLSEERLAQFAEVMDVSGDGLPFMSQYDPVLEYKDMLLRERLLRAFLIIRRECNQRRSVSICRSDLAFLCAAPLINGMRSLEALILPNVEALEREQPLSFYTDVAPTHVREIQSGLPRPSELWAELVRHDPRSPSGSSRIKLILCSPDEEHSNSANTAEALTLVPMPHKRMTRGTEQAGACDPPVAQGSE